MQDLDLFRLDKDIARAARSERAFRRALRAGDGAVHENAWYEPVRYVTTRTTFSQIAELAREDPLREPLLAWVHRLSVTRIAHQLLVEAAAAWQRPSVVLERPERVTLSPRELVRRALASSEVARTRVLLEGLGEAGNEVRAGQKRLVEGKSEINERLGATGLSLDSPYDTNALRREAEAFLERSLDLASSVLEPENDLAALLHRAVARDVPGVWPTRSHERWVISQFAGTELLSGLPLDLGPMPATFGASSFARALARFGAAYARSSAEPGAPFTLSHDPTDAHPMRRGALFSGLLCDPLYLRKKLDFSPAAANGAVRALSFTRLFEARRLAASVLFDVARATPHENHDAMEAALRVRVDPELSGMLPRPDARAPVRFAALLLATTDRQELRDRFDEDWFRNPRALFSLREADAAFRFARVKDTALEGTAARLAETLEQALG